MLKPKRKRIIAKNTQLIRKLKGKRALPKRSELSRTLERFCKSKGRKIRVIFVCPAGLYTSAAVWGEFNEFTEKNNLGKFFDVKASGIFDYALKPNENLEKADVLVSVNPYVTSTLEDIAKKFKSKPRILSHYYSSRSSVDIGLLQEIASSLERKH
ncbi:MAG: hypothetical protein QT03_C0001G1163 [archaeon GW2011_AR10]|uniref:Uncharacterized protein n=1 Tax=Candidatus Iainarchaeum sp. TaxID=3101447 RepID=A0A7J4IZ19_9ARCH|nr:MAG: hypothetical protein QT03_C0001G1163 [archaeon GW2011_AR10]HIH08216.1 hypothetical protein [Candidatus Diapherotrites archaeon]